MKKINKGKLIFWLIAIVLASLVIFQNKEFFFQKQKLSVDLFVSHFNLPPTPIVVLFIVCFLVGFLISFFFGFLQRYRTKKTIKSLNDTIANLKARLEGQMPQDGTGSGINDDDTGTDKKEEPVEAEAETPEVEPVMETTQAKKEDS